MCPFGNPTTAARQSIKMQHLQLVALACRLLLHLPGSLRCARTLRSMAYNIQQLVENDKSYPRTNDIGTSQNSQMLDIAYLLGWNDRPFTRLLLVSNLVSIVFKTLGLYRSMLPVLQDIAAQIGLLLFCSQQGLPLSHTRTQRNSVRVRRRSIRSGGVDTYACSNALCGLCN